jgi:hypothetical protein
MPGLRYALEGVRDLDAKYTIGKVIQQALGTQHYAARVCLSFSVSVHLYTAVGSSARDGYLEEVEISLEGSVVAIRRDLGQGDNKKANQRRDCEHHRRGNARAALDLTHRCDGYGPQLAS